MLTAGRAFDRSGAPLPAGTPIRTFVDGVDYSNGSRVQDALGYFSVLTSGNFMTNESASETPTVKEGADLGDSVIYAATDFTVAADVFQEILSWSPGAVVNQDLHFGSAATTPLPVKIQGIVTQPARGGPQYVLLCNPARSAASLFDYYLEVDRPGTYHGPSQSLSGVLVSGGLVRVNLTPPFTLIPTGDALKLVYRNPAGAGASAGGRDIVVDRLEYNATSGGTLYWEPGNTILGDAPAPGVGKILQRSASCADTNTPSDFHEDVEPGLPANQPPSVSILAPANGQTVQGGQTFTVQWTVGDDIFQASDLQVWVNVTYAGTTSTILADVGTRTSADWRVPDVEEPSATVRVEVIDPFGAKGAATATFRITKSQPLVILVVVLILAVIAAFVVLGYLHARRQEEKPPPVPPSPPSAPPGPPATAPTEGGPAAPAEARAGPAMKVCPRCHTSVRAEDASCFYCGYLFVTPPP